MGNEIENEKDGVGKTENEPFYKSLFKTMKLLYGKSLFDEDEEEEEEDYNVSVYQVLPYPPNTKDPKDFFIQRT